MPEVVTDVETSGLDWRHNHIVGYVYTFSPNPKDSYYIPFRHAGGGNVGDQKGPQTPTGWNGKLAKGEAELLKATQKIKKRTGHNLAFDLKFESRTGLLQMDGVRFEDTIINEPLLNEFEKFALEKCAQRYGLKPKLSAEIEAHICKMFPDVKPGKGAMGHYWRLSGADPMAVEYAEGDGTTTWQLRDEQMKRIMAPLLWPSGELKAPSLERVWDVECRLIPVLARMSIKGIKIDEELLHKTIDVVGKEVKTLMKEFPAGASIWSAADLLPYFEKKGVTDWPLTPKTGKPSIKEEWLKTSEAGKAVIKARKWTFLLDSFLVPLRDHHLWNGRVHTNFNQLRNDDFGTITGRLSSNDPNMQQIHKHNVELGKLFRALFVPDYEFWGDVDYSQIEPRLLAFYARCKVLLDAYQTDPKADAHYAVTEAMAGPTKWASMSKDERKAMRNERGKRVNQTLVTGGGKGVIVTKYGVDPKEVDKIWDDYFRAMPEIKILQGQASKRMKQNGFVRSLLGRRAGLRDPNRAYIAVNRLLQCGNADILKIKMVEVDEYIASKGRPIDMLLNCHDSVSFQFDKEHKAVYDHCLEIMQDFGPDSALPIDLPITLDQGVGHNWAEATYGEEA